jgi:sterol desaturase/sphingolipid hydroxylase (fatty acid hydroxylase superfamily)
MPPSVENGLSHLVVTPSIHWVHHHRTWVDTNSNYGAVLSIWDRLFGTRSKASRTIDMEIGVPGVDEKPFFGLLLAPFRKSDHT